MASKARGKGMTRDDIITSVIAEKSRLLQMEIFPFKSCSEGHLKKSDYSRVFTKFVMGLDDIREDDSRDVVTEQDMETGFMMFSGIVYCTEPMALYQFIHSLLSTQSPRTIIQATVNTKAGQGMICRRGEALCHRRCQALSGI
jgi:hypothetical protein